ncbi:MAG TPA: ATP-binding protein [Polyangiaceae bacterium]|nr:ATP-binding protein [Polyangiaceae bacterium]
MAADPKDERIRALEDEVRRLNVMLENAPSFITRITTDGLFLYLNRVAPGFDMKDVLGTSADSYVPPQFRARAHEAMQAAIDTQQTQQYATLGQVSAKGIGHYLTRVSPIVEDGKVSSLVMIATDVTDLEESRMLLQVALNASGLGIWTFEPKTGLGSWDETTRRIFGVDQSATDSPHLSEMLAQRIHPDDAALVQSCLAKSVETGQYGPLEHRILLPDGELRWVAASGVAVREEPSAGGAVLRIVGTVMDISQRRALEARLMDAQRLESIGRLAGGIAHDFNNMLTAILGNVDLAVRLDSLERVRPLLGEIRLTAERSAALTAQLLAFARRQLIEPKVLEPNQLLWRIEGLLRRLLGDHIELSLNLGTTGHVRADESQLEQVILNLITNARDWMPHGGRVVLETRDVTLDQADASRHPDLATGPYVSITVSDNGPGIPKAAQSQIFEPFFTTRRAGTGLGLATCYGIVKQSGGHIGVRSLEGEGTTFTVLLPRTAPEHAAKSQSERSQPNESRSERILLVEDEAVVRTVIERSLQRAGYRVSVATCAEEALEFLGDSQLDLVITDVVMPGMNGWELGRVLGERRPNLPILYISGYTGDASSTAGTSQGLPFLQKPFLPDDLLRAIRKLLDS